jgi:hypothetical protein
MFSKVFMKAKPKQHFIKDFIGKFRLSVGPKKLWSVPVQGDGQACSWNLAHYAPKNPKQEIYLSEDQLWPCSAGWQYLCRNQLKTCILSFIVIYAINLLSSFRHNVAKQLVWHSLYQRFRVRTLHSHCS